MLFLPLDSEILPSCWLLKLSCLCYTLPVHQMSPYWSRAHHLYPRLVNSAPVLCYVVHVEFQPLSLRLKVNFYFKYCTSFHQLLVPDLPNFNAPLDLFSFSW